MTHRPDHELVPLLYKLPSSLDRAKQAAAEVLEPLHAYWRRDDVTPLFGVYNKPDAKVCGIDYVVWRVDLSDGQIVYCCCRIDLTTGLRMGDPAYFPGIDDAWNYWKKVRKEWSVT